MYGKKVRNEMSCLLNGDAISCKLDEELVYNTLYDAPENIWSVLFATGYLRIEDQTWDGNETIYKLRIPNKEIRIVFANFFKTWAIDSYQQGKRKEELDKFCTAIEKGNAEEIENFLNNFLRTTISIKDYSGKKDQKESLYHGILLGLLKPQYERWDCYSNIETGDGYADIMLGLLDGQTGIIIELKYARNENLDFYCNEALEQIKNKNYTEQLRDDEYTQVIKYAIAFFKKRCKVVKKEEKL